MAEIKEASNNKLKDKLSEIFIFSKSMVPALLVLMVLLIVFFWAATPYFMSFQNFKAIITNMPVKAIVAIGMTFVLLIGGLDLSVGSILGFTAVTAVLFHYAGLNMFAVIGLSLLIGAGLGSANGVLITKVGINPVITTLGMMAFARGLASWFTLEIEALKVGRIFDQKFLLLSRLWLPKGTHLIQITLIYIIVLYVVFSFILNHTRYGRNVYATGSNEYAARLAGINVKRIQFSTYMMSGIMSSLAGVILLAQLSLGRDDAGTGAELQVITAVVLGGVSMSGGKGNLLGVIIAVFILQIIQNGMVHLEQVTGISYYWREVVKGAILILAISMDAARTIAVRKKQVVRQ